MFSEHRWLLSKLLTIYLSIVLEFALGSISDQ